MKRRAQGRPAPEYPTLLETRTTSPLWLAVLGAAAIGAGALTACVPFGQSTAGDIALPFDDDAGSPDASADGGNPTPDGGVEAPGGAAPPDAGT